MTDAPPPEAPPPAGWVRDQLANERTLLAWIRTSLGFMALGVAVAKLGVLVRLAGVDHPEMQHELPSSVRSELTGVALILFGGVLVVAGIVKSRRWARRIDPSVAPPPERTLLLVAGLTLALSLGLVLYVLL